MKELTLNNKPAVRIPAVKIHSTDKAILCDCEGDQVWFPSNLVEYDESDKTLLIEEWFYQSKVNAGEL